MSCQQASRIVQKEIGTQRTNIKQFVAQQYHVYANRHELFPKRRTPAESKTSSTGNQQETPDCSDRQPAAAFGLICGFSFILTKAPFNYKMEICLYSFSRFSFMQKCQTQTDYSVLYTLHVFLPNWMTELLEISTIILLQ